jgi:hypothetical protein
MTELLRSSLPFQAVMQDDSQHGRGHEAEAETEADRVQCMIPSSRRTSECGNSFLTASVEMEEGKVYGPERQLLLASAVCCARVKM